MTQDKKTYLLLDPELDRFSEEELNEVQVGSGDGVSPLRAAV